jgi:hypothetical protein
VVLRENRSLRAWSAGLRAWSESTREAVQAQRLQTARHRRRWDDGVSPSARATVEIAAQLPRDDRIPRMGPVRTSEMVAILVDSHGLGPTAAARSVLEGLRLAGYPEDDADVSAADAFDIIERAVGGLHP